MTTSERVRILAEVAGHFPLLGVVRAEDLLEWVRAELGHAEILDGFRPYGLHFSRAVVQDPILHIVSGNTPHAALQSLLRGLLLGARNWVKLPSSGLAEAEEFVARLPESLSQLVEMRKDLPDHWLAQARSWVVFGSDETLAHFRRKVPSGVVFEAHGHRVSLGVVFEDPLGRSAGAAARDVSRFNQKGCLSPHDFYVAGDARAYAARLAEEMAAYQALDPRGPLSVHETAEIADLRAGYRFRAASDSRVQIWESPGSSDWTVIFEDDPWFASSCLNRVVFVKPLPDDLFSVLEPVRPWLGGIGIWPARPDLVETLFTLGASRLCPIGRLQDPPLAWHQEGRQTLAPFVRWVDFDGVLV